MRLRFLERQFSQRPRILNLLHRASLVQAISQTYPVELEGLAHFARNARLALEIGSFQGVSAAYIAEALGPDGVLYCVDPWPPRRAAPNPCRAIFERHTRRKGVRGRIKVLLGISRDVAAAIPSELDFIFVDGDHSADGIAFDWSLVKAKLARGGIVCLHDVLVPPAEPWRRPDSVAFFERIILADPEFVVVDRRHSLAVLRRESP